MESLRYFLALSPLMFSRCPQQCGYLRSFGLAGDWLTAAGKYCFARSKTTEEER